MGHGTDYRCGKCGREYGVRTGTGFLFPKEYRETMKAIADGVYGAELKAICEKTPYAAVDAETKVFCCGSCGAWETGKDLTLWAPDDPAAISRKRYGEKTAEEWGCVPYVSRRTLEEEYHVVKRRYRKCPRCGHRMHRASEEELQRLPCPDCGEPNAPQGEILWD